MIAQVSVVDRIVIGVTWSQHFCDTADAKRFILDEVTPIVTTAEIHELVVVIGLRCSFTKADGFTRQRFAYVSTKWETLIAPKCQSLVQRLRLWLTYATTNKGTVKASPLQCLLGVGSNFVPR